jgi:imidazolonepropionase-like amidohydrolase
VIAGTDSPIIPYGLSLLMEIEHYVRGGLSPAEALRTATAVPADAMGLGADLGTIERGKLADLVIVDGAEATVDRRSLGEGGQGRPSESPSKRCICR